MPPPHTGQPHSQQHTPHPAQLYPHFYANPEIQRLGAYRAWTVSDNNGRPIDMGALTAGRLVGASPAHFDTALLTLDELSATLPTAANATYRAHHQLDGVLVLDVEKTCPPATALALLRLPQYYAEVSRSGRGYHLILPAPRDPQIRDDLLNVRRTALRAEGGVYEILLDHFVTFTRQPVTRDHIDHLTRQALLAQGLPLNDLDQLQLPQMTVDSMVATLIDLARSSAHPALQFDDGAAIDADELEHLRDTTPHYREIVADMVDRPFQRSIADYEGDHSAYEFAAMRWFYIRFLDAAGRLHGRVADYDDDVRAAAMYDAVTATLDHREKHDTPRAGMPYLLYTALRGVAVFGAD